MQQTCRNHWCQQNFEITDDDLAFLDKVSPVFNGKKELIPPPTLCPDCRQQRRLAMRNERNLHKRACDLCRRPIISVYAPDSPHTVYCPDCYWGDGWDALSYGRAFDFSHSFFEQFHELWKAVPKLSLIVLFTENSDYVHDSGRVKNSFLIFDGNDAEDSLNGEIYAYIKNCADFLYLTESELCYECVHCRKCYDVRYSRFSGNCSNSAFLLDCTGCKNCIACTNLVQKEYHIFNEPYEKEEYERRMAAMQLHTQTGIERLHREAEAFFLTQPRKAVRILMSENISGDNLINCRNTADSFDCMQMQDCRYCTNCALGATDCRDIDAWGNDLSLAYNSAYVGEGGQSLIGCYYVGFGTANVLHSTFCMTGGGGHYFGCDGLRKHQFCILNKQYTKEEYESLVPKIIEKMIADGEFGEFFPPNLSAFSYNETVAQDYYPLTKEEVLRREWKWRELKEEMPDVSRVIDGNLLPDNIDDIPDDILNWAIRCEVSGKLFKIQKSELAFHRRLRIPIPRRHFQIRHATRHNLRNPRKLWTRECMKCRKEIETSYPPERPEIIYCETCYLSSVY